MCFFIKLKLIESPSQINRQKFRLFRLDQIQTPDQKGQKGLSDTKMSGLIKTIISFLL